MRPEELLGYLKQATDITFIIGAGASRAAKIPMAGELVKRINAKFGYCLGHLSDEDRQDYGRVMGALSPADRKAFIEPLLQEARISWGQIALAMLVKNGNVRRILTFNFDLVLEQAASLTGQHLPVYDFGVAPSTNVAGLAEPALFHLHGQSYGLRLLNTEAETQAHRRAIAPIITDSVRNHVVIVSGYSGENDAAFEVMKEAYNDQNYLFWLGHSKEPKPHLKPLIEGNTYARYVGGCDFDEAMMTFARGLGLWPPTFVTNPPQHILEELKQVAEFPVSKEHSKDLLTPLREQLVEAGENWVGERSREGQTNANVIEGNPLEELTATELENLSDSEKETRAWALFDEAYELWRNDLGLGTPELREAMQKSNALYESALALKPDMYQAMNNRGNAFVEEANHLQGTARLANLQKAAGYYERAYEIEPEDANTIGNLGAVLTNLGEHLEADEKRETMQRADEKLEAAHALFPDDETIVGNWIHAVLVQSHFLTGTTRDKKLKHVLEKARSFIERTGVASYNFACIEAVCGNTEEALDALEAAFAANALPSATQLKTDPDLDPIREEPRFVEVLNALEAREESDLLPTE